MGTMIEPAVCCVMLTRDRPELAAKAVECFRRQTYENKRLLIFNTGDDLEIPSLNREMQVVAWPGKTIGMLRNHAMEYTRSARSADVIAHFDDDDWSHPNRITEQVALLQASGADVVGYNEMLFWRAARMGQSEDGSSRGCPECRTLPCVCDEQAWLYSFGPPKPSLGTSLCYWRKAWEWKPFQNTSNGEDRLWIMDQKVAVSPTGFREAGGDPVMIARIHPGNTSDKYSNIERSESWKRVPEWDSRVREILG